MEAQDWNKVDEAIREGGSSIEIWTRLGRHLGISLEMVVMRRQTLRAPPRRRSSPAPVLPLFARRDDVPRVANG